jgi:sugar lactone lactonase YvrE
LVANLAWGGADGKDLYFTGSTSIYRLRTKVAGTPPLYKR